MIILFAGNLWQIGIEGGGRANHSPRVIILIVPFGAVTISESIKE